LFYLQLLIFSSGHYICPSGYISVAAVLQPHRAVLLKYVNIVLLSDNSTNMRQTCIS